MIPRVVLLAILITASIWFSGCTKEALSPEESVKISTHIYPGVSPDIVLLAINDLFFLADHEAFRISQGPDHVIAIRTYGLDIGLTFVQARDTWHVIVQEIGDGSQITLNVKSEETWITGKTQVQTPRGPAVYQQFWTRLDYLVNQTKTWMSCEDLTDQYLEDRTWGDTWWLCSDVADRTPPELVQGTWEKPNGDALSLEDQKACSWNVLQETYGTAQTERQRQVYRSICLEEKGYEKITDSQEF